MSPDGQSNEVAEAPAYFFLTPECDPGNRANLTFACHAIYFSFFIHIHNTHAPSSERRGGAAFRDPVHAAYRSGPLLALRSAKKVPKRNFPF